MADIRVDVDSVLTDGMNVTFKAPCECTAIDGLKVYYVKDRETHNMRFVFKDTHGNELTGIGNLFEEGAYVHAILDTTNGFAYLQNADTNGYIESLNNAAYDARYDTPIIVGKRDDKKVYRIRKRYSIQSDFFENKSIEHGITCSDIWFDMSQSYLTGLDSDIYAGTVKVPIINPNASISIDTTSISINQGMVDTEFFLDAILYYVEV